MGEPCQDTLPCSLPCPLRIALGVPRRVNNWPLSLISITKSRRVLRSLGPSAAHEPVALKLPSGAVRLSLFKRHSRPALATVRLTASISRRPSFFPRSVKSLTTTSRAGMLEGSSLSMRSTSGTKLGGMLRKDKRAYNCAGCVVVAGRTSAVPLSSSAAMFKRHNSPMRTPPTTTRLITRSASFTWSARTVKSEGK